MAHRVRRLLPSLLLGLFALAALLHAPVAAQALPRLSITPLAGPCGLGDPPLTVRGVDFQPGQAIAVLSRRAGYTERVPKLLVGRATVAADGAFVIRGRPSDCDPSVADGTRFVIDVVPDPGPAGVLAGIPVLASAPFTKSAAPPGLPNTGGGGMAAHKPSAWGLGLGLLALGLLGVRSRHRHRA